MIQNFEPVHGGDHGRRREADHRAGPVASQEAIKQLGTNGGGFFNANSAHPFENPTPLSNLLQMFLIFLIPGGADLHVRQDGAATRGRAGRSSRRCRVMFLVGVFVCYHFEQAGNPMLAKLGHRDCTRPPASRAATWKARKSASASPTPRCSPPSPPTPVAAPSTACTTASRRSADWCRCSTSMTGEVIFGGVGAGLYGILLYCILAVFIAGLMVGRTPEYLGKKIEQKEVKMAMLAVIATAFSILVFTALSSVITFRREGLLESARARPSRT